MISFFGSSLRVEWWASLSFSSCFISLSCYDPADYLIHSAKPLYIYLHSDASHIFVLRAWDWVSFLIRCCARVGASLSLVQYVHRTDCILPILVIAYSLFAFPVFNNILHCMFPRGGKHPGARHFGDLTFLFPVEISEILISSAQSVRSDIYCINLQYVGQLHSACQSSF